MIAGVENFRRSTTRKLLGIIFKIFRRWSQRGQTLNEKLRRNFFSQAGLFLGYLYNRNIMQLFNEKFLPEFFVKRLPTLGPTPNFFFIFLSNFCVALRRKFSTPAITFVGFGYFLTEGDNREITQPC